MNRLGQPASGYNGIFGIQRGGAIPLVDSNMLSSCKASRTNGSRSFDDARKMEQRLKI